MVLNQNKILWGISMLLLNIGSRYVIADLGKSHEYILSSQIVKKTVVFSMFFVATRDLLTSFLLTISYILVIDGILHDQRPFCLLPKKILHEVNKKNVSPEEYMRAKNMIAIFEKQNDKNKKENSDDNETLSIEKKKEYINYLTNIAILKGN